MEAVFPPSQSATGKRGAAKAVPAFRAKEVKPAAERRPAFRNSRRLLPRIFSSVNTGKTLVFARLSLCRRRPFY